MTAVEERSSGNGRHQPFARPGRGERVLPHDLEAEEAVLGACMLSRAAVDACNDAQLRPEDFSRPAHGHIWSAVQALHDAGEPTEVLAVKSWLQTAGLAGAVAGGDADNEPGTGDPLGATLVGISARTPGVSSAGHYAKVVSGAAVLRRLIGAAGEIAELGYSLPDDPYAAVDTAERLIAAVTHKDRHGDTARLIGAALGDHLDLLEARGEGTLLDGAPTGLRELDDIIGGLRPGMLVTVAGRPGMAKTATGLTIATNAAAAGHPVLFSSIEMGEAELLDRSLAAKSRIDQTRLRTGALAENDWTRVTAAAGGLAELPLTIHDSPSATIARIRSRARRIDGLAVIVVDYLQIVDPGAKGESRRVDVDDLARGLKRLARTEKVCVVALAQLNRDVEQRRDKRPMLSDLRESGQIEQESDIVIGLYRDEVYHPDSKDRGVLEAIVLKQRQGVAHVTARLAYHTNTQLIADLAKGM